MPPLIGSFLLDLVLSFLRVSHEMSHIGDVGDVGNPLDLVPEMLDIALDHIKCHHRASMPGMQGSIHGRSAHVHSHRFGMYRDEILLLPGQ